ncbi:MAG: PAS domain S-box protein, partial [Deltaproteobacteria bacterium]
GLDGTIEYFNDRAIDVFGYQPQDIPTMDHWWALAYPDEAYRAETLAKWMELVGKAITLGTEIERRDYRVTCKDGSLKTVVIFGAIVAGKAFVMFEDITERERAADEALRERENNLAAIAENANDGILIASPATGRICYANRRAADITGYGVAELLEIHVQQLAHPEEPHWIGERQRSREAGIAVSNPFEARAVTRTGAFVPLEVSTTLTVWNGQPANLVVVRDITERRRAEEDRAKLQDQLAHSQKLEAIGRLAGGVAHDFNNILAGILGGLSLMDLDLGETDPHRADVREMMALVGRGAELAKQLLGFARRGKYVVRALDLASVIQKTATLFGRTRKDVTVHLDLAPGLLAVLMDHAQLEQVLLNLFLNAGHAMPDGGLLAVRAENVEVSSSEAARREVAAGEFVRVVVADTGVGMDSATLARVFEPFFTTKALGQGTGLGLASAYGIIKSHGGLITVESAPGAGASFTLWLPGGERAAAEARTPEAPTQRGTATILVVDDEPHIV